MIKALKYCIIAIILSNSYRAAIAQPAPSDSLQNALASARTDSVKVEVLIALAKENTGSVYLQYANEALSLARNVNYKNGIASAHAALGRYFYFAEDLSASLFHCMTAFNIAKETGNNKIMAYACLFIGFNHYQDQPKTSLSYYLKCINYCKLANDPKLEAYGYSAIGNLYEAWYDGKNALNYYTLSLDIRQRIGEPGEIVSSMIETARAYNRLKNYDRSYDYIQKALKIAEAHPGNEQNLVYLYEMMGHEYTDRFKDHKKALSYFLRSRQIAIDNDFIDKNNFNNVKPIAETYLKLGDHKNSALYFKLYNDLLEENKVKMGREAVESRSVLKTEIEKQKQIAKQAENELQLMSLQEEKSTRNFYIALIGALVIIIFFVFRTNILKEKLNIDLEAKVKERTAELDLAYEKLKLSENQLKEINKELETFIYRTSHDLKGPLSSSRGLINLALKAKSPETLSQYLGLIQTSLEKLDNILVTLYEVSVIRKGTLNLKECNIEEVITNLIKSFENYPNYSNINFNINNRLSAPFVTDEILSQTILRNIIENAIKYSCQGHQEPYVRIDLKNDANYQLISISDNGVGIPEEHHKKIFDVFYRANTNIKGSGMGLYIVKNAIDKLNGKIELANSAPKQGTTFNLYFPAQKYKA